MAAQVAIVDAAVSDLFHDVTVVTARPSSLQKVSRALPSKQMKQVSQAVAVSVAALALEGAFRGCASGCVNRKLSRCPLFRSRKRL